MPEQLEIGFYKSSDDDKYIIPKIGGYYRVNASNEPRFFRPFSTDLKIRCDRHVEKNLYSYTNPITNATYVVAYLESDLTPVDAPAAPAHKVTGVSRDPSVLAPPAAPAAKGPTPAHYIEGRAPAYEPRRVIEAWGLGYYLGSACKYISRAGRKGSAADHIRDLEKAIDFLNFEIERLRAARSAP